MSEIPAFDLAIVGAGPGGYVAALRAAQLGMKVCLIERDALGGVCMNRGCIPTKAMLETAGRLAEFEHARDFGIRLEGTAKLDYAALVGRRKRIVRRLVGGVKGLLRRAGVEVIFGIAALVDETTISVTPLKTREAELLTAPHIVIATGSKPARLGFSGESDARVIDSDGALALDAVPERLLVVGGGAVGCEWATIFQRLGSEVTLVELMPSLLSQEEPEAGALLAKAFTKEGVVVHTDTSVVEATGAGDALRVQLTGACLESLAFDKVLVAAGRAPLTEGLNLDGIGVETCGKGWIDVDDHQRTNLQSILAIGDVTGKALLAHVASRQGIVAVEQLAGLTPTPVRFDRVPSVVFTDPEVASVGLTEARARGLGVEVEIGVFPFSANGRAQAAGTESGFVKVVSEGRFGRVLGVHMVGPHVGELLAEAVLAMELEATVDELATIIRPHPTLSETIGEAALATAGRALHF